MLAELKKKTKYELVQIAERLTDERNALRTVLSSRYYKLSGKECIALPLTHDERSAVKDYASNMASKYVGEGTIIGRDFGTDDRSIDLDNAGLSTTFDLPIEWCHDQILPQFLGLVIHYTYNKLSGTDVVCVWGLMEVR